MFISFSTFWSTLLHLAGGGEEAVCPRMLFMLYSFDYDVLTAPLSYSSAHSFASIWIGPSTIVADKESGNEGCVGNQAIQPLIIFVFLLFSSSLWGMRPQFRFNGGKRFDWDSLHIRIQFARSVLSHMTTRGTHDGEWMWEASSIKFPGLIMIETVIRYYNSSRYACAWWPTHKIKYPLQSP